MDDFSDSYHNFSGDGGKAKTLSSIILGIDPGSLRTGYGVLRVKGDHLEYIAHGVLALKEENFAARLSSLQIQLCGIIEKHQPHVTVVEKVFLGRNADSAFKLGHARGVVLAAASSFGSEVVEYAPRYVKKAVTGSGAASKEQVQMLVVNLLKIKDQNPKLFDATDALSLAICHARVFEVNEKMRRFTEAGL
jgi:crossover junction endodeoxyribonuclease RuvC